MPTPLTGSLRIAFVAYAFPPAVGGLEMISLLLAREFVAAGHRVTVITQTPSDQPETEAFAVLRRPDDRTLLRVFAEADLVFQSNVTMRLAWPLWVMHRPWVVAHQTWLSRTDGQITWLDRFKRLAVSTGVNISISRAIAARLPVRSLLVPNTYDSAVFHARPGIARDRDFVFVGRLVSDKGVDLAIEAVARLRALGLRPTLTIAGSGPERPALEAQVRALGLEAQVAFAGVQRGAALAELLHRHRIMVVPSRWQEPFGIVALEGIACGCVPVGSAGGGLPDAIGRCGPVFANGDTAALTSTLAHLLRTPAALDAYRAHFAAHLATHTPKAVAGRYLDVIGRAADVPVLPPAESGDGFPSLVSAVPAVSTSSSRPDRAHGLLQ